MARTRSASDNHELHGSHARASGPNGEQAPGLALPGMPDWLNAPLADPKKALDSMLEMQSQWFKTASTSSETLASDLKGLQQAKDPVEFVAAQVALANQQLEVLARQVGAAMQQIFDAQLLWLGQWDDKSAARKPVADPGAAAFGALTKAQDDWLKMTQSWIDHLNSASSSH